LDSPEGGGAALLDVAPIAADAAAFAYRITITAPSLEPAAAIARLHFGGTPRRMLAHVASAGRPARDATICVPGR
jgi:hypothetical protein